MRPSTFALCAALLAAASLPAFGQGSSINGVNVGAAPGSSGGGSVSITGGTGITVTPSPITGTGSVALTTNTITIGGQVTALGGSTTNQGNGSKIQLSTGSTTTNDCAKYDVTGNTVDSGGACSPPGGSPTQLQYNNAGAFGGITGATTNGAVVTLTSPVFITPALGTPASGVLTHATGLPVSTGISGLGTGVGTALQVNIGTAGAPVVNGGALGTPSGGTATNITGLVPSTGLAASGTPSSTTILEGDNKWVTIPAATSSVLGLSSPDNVTIKATAGVYADQYPTNGDLMLSAGSGAVPTAYPGASGCPSPQVVTAIGAAGTTTCAAPTTPLVVGSGTASLTGPNEIYVCTTTCTITPPVPAAGYKFCIENDATVSTVITIGGNTSVFYQLAVAPGTPNGYGASGGHMTSGGAVGDTVCIIGRDSTHYLVGSFGGAWTNS